MRFPQGKIPPSIRKGTLIRYQGIICGVSFGRSSLRRIDPYASVVAPRRLASDTFLAVRNTPYPDDFSFDT